MAALRLFRALGARGRVWLLAWALCLPLAQWASAAHALLHLQSAATSEERDTPAQAPASCDLCAAAASLGSAAPLPALTLPAPASLRHTQPVVAAEAPARAAAFTPFRSRAPPFLHA